MAYSWLIFLSLLRDDVPWLYEPGMEFYRALQRGKPNEIQRAREALIRLIKFTDQSKLLHRLLRENDESGFLLHRLSDMIYRFVSPAGREMEEGEEDDINVVRKND